MPLRFSVFEVRSLQTEAHLMALIVNVVFLGWLNTIAWNVHDITSIGLILLMT